MHRIGSGDSFQNIALHFPNFVRFLLFLCRPLSAVVILPVAELPAMKTNSDLKTLDDLLVTAADFSEYFLRAQDHVPAAMFLIGVEGAHLYYTSDFQTETALDQFQRHTRLLAMAHAPTAAVMVLPGLSEFDPADGDDPPVPAAAECLLLLGEDKAGQKSKAFMIVRSDNGKFFGLDDSVQSVKDAEGSKGIQILPKPDPDAEARHWAKGELKAEGIKTIPLVRQQ